MLLFNSNTFSSLKHKDFRYFIVGQAISSIGTWMQRTAQTWLLYTMTNSAFLVGLLGVFQCGPMLLLSLFSGVIVDRFPKKKLLYITQTAYMIQALILYVLVFTKSITCWQIFALAVISGLVTTLDMPTRQSYFVELVGKRDLPNAISLNSTIFNIAKVAGPSIAGIIIYKLGISFCFLFNFLSFIAVFIGIFMISAKDKVLQKPKESLIEEIKSGLVYIYSNKILLKTVIIMAITCTFAMNIDVISPVFSKTVLGKGVGGYTMLLSFLGIGSFIGAVKMAGRKRSEITLKLLIYCAFMSSIFQIAASFSRNLYFCALLVLGSGYANLSFLNTGNSTLQLNTEDKYRGRVMSVYSLINVGTTPIGNLIVGASMDNFGGASGFFLSGMVTMVIMIIFCIVNAKKTSLKKML